MDEDQLNDLKQFIAATISQTEQSIRSDMNTMRSDMNTMQSDMNTMRSDMEVGFSSINQKIDEGFAGIGEAIEQIHQQAEIQEAEVDRRFTKLEQQIA